MCYSHESRTLFGRACEVSETLLDELSVFLVLRLEVAVFLKLLTIISIDVTKIICIYLQHQRLENVNSRGDAN